MTRWLTALLMALAALVAAPVPARAEAAGREHATCCGGNCCCGPACACASGDEAPARDDHPAQAPTDRSERLGALPLAPRAELRGIEEFIGTARALQHQACAHRPAGRTLLEQVSRWTT